MEGCEKKFSGKEFCGHCGNTAPMEIVSQYSQVRDYDDERSQFRWSEGHWLFRFFSKAATDAAEQHRANEST
jgi:hypothetical protein